MTVYKSHFSFPGKIITINYSFPSFSIQFALKIMSKFSNLSIKALTTAAERKEALKVRIAVFVDEQKYSLEDELDR